MIKDRSGVFGRDLVTFDEVVGELGRFSYGKTRTHIINALVAVGAVPLGQKRVSGTWEFGRYVPTGTRKISLWAIRHGAFWESAAPRDIAAEFGRGEGFFSGLDAQTACVLIGHFAVQLCHGDDHTHAAMISNSSGNVDDAGEAERRFRALEEAVLANWLAA